MSWAARLRTCTANYENKSQCTRVFEFTGPSDYMSPVIVKEVTCATEAALQKAMKEAEFGRTCDHPYLLKHLGWKQEPNPAGGSFVYIFSPPMSKSLQHVLDEHVISKQFFLEHELKSLYDQLLEVFCYMQSHGHAHRDIKPANILIDQQGQVKVCDYGFIKDVNAGIGRPSTLVMTPAYASPALWDAYNRSDQRDVDHDVFKSDVFSLGLTLAHLSLLPEPTNIPSNWKDVQQFINFGLNGLTQRYSEDWVKLICSMLRENEEQRPDFLALRGPGEYADDHYLPTIPPEEEPVEPLALSVRCGLPQIRVSPMQVDEVPCMISLIAAEQDLNRRTYGVDLVWIIDKSGSMRYRIPLVKASLCELLNMLGDRDRVSIIGFNVQAKRECPLVRCTAEGKEHLRAIIQSLTCSGKTSITPGFLMGLEVLKQRRSINQAASLMLLSDGEDNKSEDPAALCTTALQASTLERLSVFTFGYGSKVNTELLEALTTIGQGVFHHITQPGDIQKAFALAFYNATNVVARNLRVELAIEGDVLCKITKLYTKDANNAFVIDYLCANTRKELIFLLKPPYVELPARIITPVIQVTLTYEDNEGVECKKRVVLGARFVKFDGKVAAAEDSDVYRHWYRVRGADYLREARENANNGLFGQAEEILSRGIDAVQTSSYAHIPLVQSVLQDMMKAREMVRSEKSWQQGGDPHLASISYSHFSQSATISTLQYAPSQQAEQLANS